MSLPAARRTPLVAAATLVAALATGTAPLASGAASKPSIARFAPLKAQTLASIRITGTGFVGVKEVAIGGHTASFHVVSATAITATVPGTATSGDKVIVAAKAGTATSTARLTVLPTLSGFSPAKAKALAKVTISGRAFSGVSKVTIGGHSASFHVVSATTITATVASGTTSGKVVITTKTGTATSTATLTVLAAIPTPTLVGNPIAGKGLFISNSCSACHTLAAAGAKGTLGPDLDNTSLTQSVIIAAITNGGATVMSPSAVAQYATSMSAYKGVLSTTQIADVAAFVYVSTHH